jgi:septum formation protein
MLQSLSGRTHQVYTGITIKTADKTITETDVADVNLMKSLMMK